MAKITFKPASRPVDVKRNDINMTLEMVSQKKGAKQVYPGFADGENFNRDNFETWFGGAEKLDNFLVSRLNSQLQQLWIKSQESTGAVNESSYVEMILGWLDGERIKEMSAMDYLVARGKIIGRWNASDPILMAELTDDMSEEEVEAATKADLKKLFDAEIARLKSLHDAAKVKEKAAEKALEDKIMAMGVL